MNEHLAAGEDPAEPTSEAPVAVLLSTNARFLQHAIVCLTSLLANNPDLAFDLVIAHRPSESLDEGRARRSLARFTNFSLRLEGFTTPSGVSLSLNPKAHYTIDTYARLWIGTFFPMPIRRALYFDVDIVVTGSIAPLWNTDLDGALLGAVDIPGSTRGVTLLGLPAEDGYFNSGMLLIDLAQWRETGATETTLEYIRANPEVMIYDLDQDALNGCFHSRRKPLPYIWNAIGPFFRDPCPLPLSRKELATVRRDARVIHFNGASKPWNYFCAHPRRDEYTKYLRMTEWRDYVPPDRTLPNMVRKVVGNALPSSVKDPIRGILGRIPIIRTFVRPVW